MGNIIIAKEAKRRGLNEIQQLLDRYESSGQSIKAYCQGLSISANTFYNWRKKYGKAAVGGFVEVHLTSPSQCSLFAEVGKIRVYQPVSASYLKELAL